MMIRTYLVKNKGNRHEKQSNTAKKRVTWANAELREKLARLQYDLCQLQKTRHMRFTTHKKWKRSTK